MTLPLPLTVEDAVAFIDSHVIYWIMLGALVFELRYLLQKERRETIAMSRLGTAERHQQPAFFCVLWLLHGTTALFFIGMVARYLGSLVRG